MLTSAHTAKVRRRLIVTMVAALIMRAVIGLRTRRVKKY